MAENAGYRWQAIIGAISIAISILVVIFGGVFWVANTALMKSSYLDGQIAGQQACERGTQ